MASESQKTDSSWSARWCWIERQTTHPWNRYVLFRKAVELTSQPRRAIVRVSADARYTLYVNGRRVHQGPARGFPEHQSFDTLDLRPLLDVGRNSLCAIVHQFGTPTYQSVYRDASGLLLDGAIDLQTDSIPLHTPEGWICRQARGWRKDVARLSVALGFQEHYDADADPPNWMDPAFEPSTDDGWIDPIVHGPVGVLPWISMEPHGTASGADRIEPFKQIVGVFTGENARGYKITPEVFHFAASEKRWKEKGLLEDPTAMLGDDPRVTIVPPPADGHFVMAVLDLGQLRPGHLVLDIDDANGDEIIDVLYTHRALASGAPELTDGSAVPSAAVISGEGMGDRYRCRPGAQHWEPFFFKGFRYATLIFRNVEKKPLKIRHVAVREVRSALSDSGAFSCSDERLTNIWAVARDTLRACMLDACIDSPGGEQAQWLTDLPVAFASNVYAHGDVALLERAIRQARQSQASDGSLQAHPPSDCPRSRIPDAMLAWVDLLWDWHWQTGKTKLLRESAPAMHRLFEFFAGHEIDRGMIGRFDGWWVFLDSAPVWKQDLSALLNLIYLKAMSHAADVCGLIDDPLAEQYRAKARTLGDALRETFWDPTRKVWRDGFDPATNTPVEQVSQQTNALAVLLKLNEPEDRQTIARTTLLRAAGSRRTRIITASPRFYTWVNQALIECGMRAEVVDLIGEKWGRLLDEGDRTFPESWEDGERCHVSATAPLQQLSRIILGIEPTAAGWQKVRIQPFAAGLDFARGVVPSPHGEIKAEWEKVGDDQLVVRIDLPAGIEADFIDPRGEKRPLSAGPNEFQT